MYKDIVIKKRVWMPEDDIDISNWEWCELFEDSSAQIESTIVDFNGRIPVEDGVIVGEWMTNGIQLIKADMGELLSEDNERFKKVGPFEIESMFNRMSFLPGYVLPIGVYENTGWHTAIRFSNGEQFADIDIKYFQYIYEGDFDYQLFSFNNGDYGLLLKYDGLVCGAVMGMNLHNQDSIWERPYSLADVEALNIIQGDPALS